MTSQTLPSSNDGNFGRERGRENTLTLFTEKKRKKRKERKRKKKRRREGKVMDSMDGKKMVFSTRSHYDT